MLLHTHTGILLGNKKDRLTYTVARWTLKTSLREAGSNRPPIAWCHYMRDLQRQKIGEWLPRTGGWEEKGASAISEHGISLKGKENILKLIVMMVAHLCEYTKTHRTVYFNCVNYTSIKQSFKKDHYGNTLNPCITCLEGKNQRAPV